MPKPVVDTTLTNANARLTADKGVGNDNYPAEPMPYIRDSRGQLILQCDRYNELSEDILKLNTPGSKSDYLFELEKQFAILRSTMMLLRMTSTACLFRA